MQKQGCLPLPLCLELLLLRLLGRLGQLLPGGCGQPVLQLLLCFREKQGKGRSERQCCVPALPSHFSQVVKAPRKTVVLTHEQDANSRRDENHQANPTVSISLCLLNPSPKAASPPPAPGGSRGAPRMVSRHPSRCWRSGKGSVPNGPAHRPAPEHEPRPTHTCVSPHLTWGSNCSTRQHVLDNKASGG